MKNTDSFSAQTGYETNAILFSISAVLCTQGHFELSYHAVKFVAKIIKMPYPNRTFIRVTTSDMNED